MSVLIYSEKSTARLTYTAELIFDTILKIPYDITNDFEKFKLYQGAKILYHKNKIDENSLFIKAQELLFEEDIHKLDFEVEVKKNFKVFFVEKNTALGFDPFAASFFLVSRYEEYLPSQLDKMKRFKAENSKAFQRNFLTIPVVNHYALDLAEELKKMFPDFVYEKPKHKFRVEIVINSFFAYKYQNPIKIFFDLAALFFTFKFKKLLERTKIHLGFKKDPYDTLLELKSLEEKFNYKFNYFISPRNASKIKNFPQHIKSYIEKLSNEKRVGIVFQYDLSERKALRAVEKISPWFNAEKGRVSMSKFCFPNTLNILTKTTIKEDYTMSYPNQNGFRAGIATPFKLFDLKNNQKTDLISHPVVLTDKMLKFHMKVRASDVGFQVRNINNQIKEVGGTCTIIFHNESSGKQKAWKNWGDTLETIMKSCL